MALCQTLESEARRLRGRFPTATGDDFEFTHFQNEETMPGYLTNIDTQTLETLKRPSARTIAKAEADDRAIERWEDEGGRVSSGEARLLGGPHTFASSGGTIAGSGSPAEGRWSGSVGHFASRV